MCCRGWAWGQTDSSLARMERSIYTTIFGMPDSLYRTNLNDEGCMIRALIVGIITVVVLLYFTTRLYNKKDIK